MTLIVEADYNRDGKRLGADEEGRQVLGQDLECQLLMRPFAGSNQHYLSWGGICRTMCCVPAAIVRPSKACGSCIVSISNRGGS